MVNVIELEAGDVADARMAGHWYSLSGSGLDSLPVDRKVFMSDMDGFNGPFKSEADAFAAAVDSLVDGFEGND